MKQVLFSKVSLIFERDMLEFSPRKRFGQKRLVGHRHAFSPPLAKLRVATSYQKSPSRYLAIYAFQQIWPALPRLRAVKVTK